MATDALVCPMCGGRPGVAAACNRGVCGLWRTAQMDFLVDGEVVRHEATVPPNVHMKRAAADVLSQLVTNGH